MCGVCGCSGHTPEEIDPGHGHGHDHPHSHAHGPDHPHAHGEPDHPHVHGERDSRIISLEQRVLQENDRIAERNRGWLAGRGVLGLNFVSSPGSGKTTLLERTIRDLSGEVDVRVIQGDQATDRDAARIQRAGARAVQVNTGTGCHLDASMIARVLADLDPPAGGLLAIENVGNLVCPALFDLGEHCKVVVASVVEGEDKPLKYPHMFRASQLLLLNKVDLLPYVDFDVQQCVGFAREVNPDLEVLQVSATRGEGLERWYAWLRARLGEATRRSAAESPRG